jgi:hypothetical protein
VRYSPFALIHLSTLPLHRDATQWLSQVRDHIERHDIDLKTHWFREGVWRELFDTPSYSRFFNPPEEEVLRYTLPRTLHKFASRTLKLTRSKLDRVKLKMDVKKIIETGHDVVWIAKGVFEFPVKTILVMSQRK